MNKWREVLNLVIAPMKSLKTTWTPGLVHIQNINAKMPLAIAHHRRRCQLYLKVTRKAAIRITTYRIIILIEKCADVNNLDISKV